VCALYAGLWLLLLPTNRHTKRRSGFHALGQVLGCVAGARLLFRELLSIRQHHQHKKKNVVDLKDVKVADGRGNPLIISGIVTYAIRDSQKAVFGTGNVLEYVNGQALIVIKKTAAMYPYESKDGHSLKGEAEKIRLDMVGMLQERVNVSGVHIINFELTDLAYAPEIARNMLVRQQAEALVDARKVIVQGAVEIAHSAIVELERKGIKLNEDHTARVVCNLLVTICGESGVQPTMNISG